MQRYKINLERTVLLNIIKGSSEISKYLLGNLRMYVSYKNDSSQKENHFGHPTSQEIFKRMYALIREGKTIDYSFLEDPSLSDEAHLFLKEKSKKIKTKEVADNYIEKLEFYRKVREVYKHAYFVADQLRKQKASQENLQEIQYSMEDTLQKMVSDKDINRLRIGDDSNSDEILDKILNPDKKEKIKTGFTYFDKLTGGLERSNVLVLAGPTGGGKSVMATQMATYMYAKLKLNINMINFEMGRPEVYKRILSGLTKIPFNKINKNNITPLEANKIATYDKKFNAIGKKYNCRLDVNTPQAAYTAEQLVLEWKALSYDVIIVDYVGLVSPSKSSNTEAQSLSDIVRTFKIAASKLNAVVIILAQLNTTTKEVKYSKAIKEHANFMWQWEWDYDDYSKNDIIKINQTKARNSRPASWDLQNNFEIMRWENCPEKNEEALRRDEEEDNSEKDLMYEETSPYLVLEDDD